MPIKTTVHFADGLGDKRYKGVLLKTIRGQPFEGMITFVFENGRKLSVWENRIQHITHG